MHIDTFKEHFQPVQDPRQIAKVTYPLFDVLFGTLCSVIAGARGWTDIREYVLGHHGWFLEQQMFQDGVPVDDTFARIISTVKPDLFRECFLTWMKAVHKITQGDVVAIDGKTLRGSYDREDRSSTIHMISAYASVNKLVLGQLKTDKKSNEITAIPELLKMLDLRGALVSIDAMACQTKIAEQIIEQEGDYVLALKGNQSTLASEVEEAFIDADAKDYAGMESEFLETTEHGHGRVETRCYRTLGDLSGVPRSALWRGMNMIGMVESHRTVDGKTSCETRFFIGSIGTDAACFARAVRDHWGIENELHWTLDVAFREDDSRVREPAARENLAVLRHIALTRLKKDKTKLGIKNKRLKAGWDERYLAKLLFESPVSTEKTTLPLRFPEY